MKEVAQAIQDIINSGIDILEKGLGITLQTMLIQLVATLILFLVVRFTLWEKITKILDDRKDMISKGLEEKDQAILQAQQIKEELALQKIQTKKEGQDIIEEAKRQAREEATLIMKAAYREIEDERNKSKEELQIQIERLEKETKDQIVDIAALLAQKIIEEEMDEKKHQKLIQDFLNEIGQKDVR